MRKLWLVLAVLVVGGSIGPAMAQAQLDSSFGQDGIVSVNFPGGIRAMGAAPDGSSYVLTENWKCAGPCEVTSSLYRYTPEGVLDQGFGDPGGFYGLGPHRENTTGLVVDSQGLPLLTETGGSGMVIRRLTPSGAADSTFGTNGVVDLPCECLERPTQLIPTPGGGVTMVTSSISTMAVLRVVHLQADGAPDPRFGRRGTATFDLRDAQPFTAVAASQRGAIYLAGPVCCHFSHPLYLARISVRGRLDTRFLSTARRSLNSIGRIHRSAVRITAVLPRPGGKIDLLGYTGHIGHRRGFLVRLDPNGHLHRRFGRRGLQVLPYPVGSAALGSDGSILAAGDASVVGGYALRILAGGRIDPAFTPRRIPGFNADTGISIVHVAGRRAMLLDLGLHECRGTCIKNPKLIRYLEPPPQR